MKNKQTKNNNNKKTKTKKNKLYKINANFPREEPAKPFG